MKELPIHIELDSESRQTLYEQIYEYIREEIRAGRLMQDEKLPSARFLADYLQVSRTTVDMAYGQLVSEGYLEARSRKGYFVSAIEDLYAMDQVMRRTDVGKSGAGGGQMQPGKTSRVGCRGQGGLRSQQKHGFAVIFRLTPSTCGIFHMLHGKRLPRIFL